MIIRSVTCTPVSVPLRSGFKYSLGSLEKLDYCFVHIVFISSPEEIAGIGECSIATDVTGETQESVVGFFKIAEATLLGKEIVSLASITEIFKDLGVIAGNQTAKAGLEMALLDGLGKLLNAPVSDIIGVRKHEHISSQAVIPFMDLSDEDGIKRKVAILLSEGAKSLKIKLGREDAYDLKIVELVRKAAPKTKICVDVNQGWRTYEQAKEIIERLKGFNIEWFEQPVLAHDWEALSRLCSPGIKIMADESIQTFHQCSEFLKHYKVDYINIKLAKCGGLLEAKKIAELCSSKGVGVFIGSMIETSVGTSASLHLASIIDYVQTDAAALQFVDKHFSEGIIEENHEFMVPRGPGLGVGLDIK